MCFDKCYEVFGFFKKLEICIYLLYLLFIGLIILYYSFGIYILANEYNMFLTLDHYCDSKLWYYALFSMIGIADKLMLRNIESIYSYSKIYYLLFLIEILIIIFGSIELWYKRCIYNYIPDNNDLYTFCLVNYLMQLVMSFILILKIFFMVKNKKRLDTIDEIDYFDNIDNHNIENNNVDNVDNVDNQNIRFTNNYVSTI